MPPKPQNIKLGLKDLIAQALETLDKKIIEDAYKAINNNHLGTAMPQHQNFKCSLVESKLPFTVIQISEERINQILGRN